MHLDLSKVNTKQLITIIILVLGIAGCRNAGDKIVKKNLPRNLNEAVAYFNSHWNSIEKLKFKNQPEDEAVTSLHFSTGLWIRNNWIRGDRDTSLVKYFNKIGIYAADDMSSIILTSFHRQLNHKALYINEQVKPYKLYWKSISDCEEKSKKDAVYNYHKYNVGNPIIISMYVDTSQNYRDAVLFACPSSDWNFNPRKDLIINGVVIEKHFINDIGNVFFKVRINKMNYPNTAILMNTVKVGSVIDLPLDHLNIK